MSDMLKSSALIKQELKVDGFSVLTPNEHNFTHVTSLASWFDELSGMNSSSPYKPMIFRNHDLYGSSNSALSTYNNFCLRLINRIGSKQNHLDAIFATTDTPDSHHLAQDPHFDMIPTLKFMIYLNDLSFSSGAFCLSPGSHFWTRDNFGQRHQRKPYGAVGFIEQTRTIPEYILNKLKPIEGKAGTVIVFDTDCVHHQGIVQSDKSNILRAHYRTRRPFLKTNIKRLLSMLPYSN